MSLTRLTSVVKSTLIFALLLGGVLAAPYILDVAKGLVEEPPVESETRGTHADRFAFEQSIVQMGKDPLAWDCHDGSPDRVRYYRDSCFAEHFAEFTLAAPPSRGKVQLVSRGEALFTDEKGMPLRGINLLTASQTKSLRSFLISALPMLPSHVDNWQMPAYTGAIEACIDGNSFVAVRRISNDYAFESIASEIASRSGLTISRSSPGQCM